MILRAALLASSRLLLGSKVFETTHARCVVRFALSVTQTVVRAFMLSGSRFRKFSSDAGKARTEQSRRKNAGVGMDDRFRLLLSCAGTLGVAQARCPNMSEQTMLRRGSTDSSHASRI